MAAPAYRSSTIPAGATATTHTATEPTGAADGDILVATAYWESITATCTPPAGWSNVFNGTTVGAQVLNDFTAQTFWIRRSGTPALTFTMTASTYGQVSCVAYSGAVASGNPWSFSAVASNTGSTNTFPSVSGTTLTADEICYWAGTNFNGTLTPLTQPSGFTSRIATNAQDIFVADLTQAVAGSVTASGATWTTTPGDCASFLAGLQSVAVSSDRIRDTFRPSMAVHRASRW